MKKIIFVISFITVFVFLFSLTAPDIKAQTITELQVKIQQLKQQIIELEKQLEQKLSREKTAWCYNFNVNLRIGDSGERVRALQTALEKEGFYQGTITGNFNEYTALAVVRFQEKHRSKVLAPWGLTRGTGFVGPTTRTELNTLYGCSFVNEPAFEIKPFINVISPNGGQELKQGDNITITWESREINHVDIDLLDWKRKQEDGSIPFVLDIATNYTASKGTYTWKIPSDWPTGSLYKIRVTSSRDNAVKGMSDEYFSIIQPPPFINVISPNGGENWDGEKQYKITWDSSNNIYSRVDILIAGYDSLGRQIGDWKLIVSGVSASRKYYYWVPAGVPLYLPSGFEIIPNKYKIKIREATDRVNAITDISSNYFNIK